MSHTANSNGLDVTRDQIRMLGRMAGLMSDWELVSRCWKAELGDVSALQSVRQCILQLETADVFTFPCRSTAALDAPRTARTPRPV